MDSLDLLAREDEFKKLNKQLEKKTESLMKQIELSMQKQDIFSEFSHNLTLSPQHTSKKHCCDTPSSSTSTPKKHVTRNPSKSSACHKKAAVSIDAETVEENASQEPSPTSQTSQRKLVCECCAADTKRERICEDLEFLYAFISVSVQEKVLPQAFLKDRATVENVCKFLSSKIKLMQEQIEKLQTTINRKATQCEVHLRNQAELESERMVLLNKCNNYQANTADMKAKYMAAQKKLEEKDRLYKEQRSEADKLTSEVKHLRSKTVSLEARSASLEESNSSLRQQLEAARKAEKDFRDSTRTLSASHQNNISKLETRIKNLTTRSNRQEKLIQNLREQRSILMAEGALKVLEKEYSAFLLKDF